MLQWGDDDDESAGPGIAYPISFIAIGFVLGFIAACAWVL
jgi:hypothetical protein